MTELTIILPAINEADNLALLLPKLHEVAKTIQSEPLVLLLRHGILKERFAALATDALRAAALESAGYRTQILEFVDLDHTPKNLLIRAVKRRDGEAVSRESYEGLKTHLGLTTLATDQIRS